MYNGLYGEHVEQKFATLLRHLSKHIKELNYGA